MSYTVFNPDTVKDVAESIGIASLGEDVARALAMDVEYRIHEVVQVALQFMRHSKRTTLKNQDIDDALESLNVEPILGFNFDAPVKFREAFYSPAEPPIFFLDDEELDFDKIINMPLPKVPRQVSYTAHWLAIEGVQPSIPQNASSDFKQAETSFKQQPSSNSIISSLSGGQPETKPLVRHVLSKELMLYFEKITSILIDESNPTLRAAALQSLRNDPGLHQLLPYFVSFIAEKVTHELKNVFILEMMIQMTEALLSNSNLFIEPYIHQFVVPIMTCVLAKKIGDPQNSTEHYAIRDQAASMLQLICKKLGDVYQTLRPRVVRTLLKSFLDKSKPLGTHYGAICALSLLGPEIVRILILPNAKMYSTFIKSALDSDSEQRRIETERNIAAIVNGLFTLKEEHGELLSHLSDKTEDQIKESVKATLGDAIGEAVVATDDMTLMKSLLPGPISGTKE